MPLDTAGTPDASAVVVGTVSEVQQVLKESLPDSEAFESVGDAVEAVAIAVPVGNGQMPRNLGADGRPLPEGNVNIQVEVEVDVDACCD